MTTATAHPTMPAYRTRRAEAAADEPVWTPILDRTGGNWRALDHDATVYADGTLGFTARGADRLFLLDYLSCTPVTDGRRFALRLDRSRSGSHAISHTRTNSRVCCGKAIAAFGWPPKTRLDAESRGDILILTPRQD